MNYSKLNLIDYNLQFLKFLINYIKHSLVFLFIILLNFCLYAKNDEVANAFGLGSDEGYYSIDEVYAKMDFLSSQYQEICTSKFSIGNTNKGNPIYAFKISDNPNIDEDEPAVYYDAAQHGNEKITMAVTINYMMWLCEQYGSNDEVTYLVNNREMYFVPVVNVDGYKIGKRRNGRITPGANCDESQQGVDLNRNYSVAYGSNEGSSDNPCSPIYRGEAAFSEPESRAVRDFVLAIEPICAFSTHAYGASVLMPSGFSAIPTEFNIYADLASEMYADNNYFYGTTRTVIGYVSSGTTRDYLDSLDIIAYTPEIRAHSGTIEGISNAVAENVKPMRTLAWLSGAYVVVKNHQLLNDILPGSSFNMAVAVKNKGKGAIAQNVNVSVTSNNNNITPTSNFVVYDYIVEQGILSNAVNPFTFAVSNNAQAGESAILEIKVTINGVQTDLYKVPVVVGEKDILFMDNAETNSTNWTVEGEFGFEAGTETPSLNAWGVDSANSYSGTLSFSESINGLASTNQSVFFTTKSINLNSTNLLKVQFAAKWSFGFGDTVILQAEINNDDNWTNIETYSQSSDWIYKIIDLSAYTEGTLRLRFWHKSNNSSTGDGFYFDDFEIVNYSEQPIITITNPGTGNTFTQGDVINIEWTDNISENVMIRLFKNGLFWSLISLSLPNEGSHSYDIPSNINVDMPNDRFQIYVQSTTNPSIYDYSDFFTIQSSASSCTDGIQNGDETGIDCGGSCPPCKPDLEITTCGSVSISGNLVTVSNVVVKNIGTATTSTYSYLGYYLSTDKVINSDDYYIGLDYVPSLAPSSTSAESVFKNISSVSPPIPAGTYYVGMLADYRNNISEANENNNSCYDITPTFTVTYGCKDASAHNYEPNATYKDETLCETCTDNVQNGDETGVDCGGNKCSACEGSSSITVTNPGTGDTFTQGDVINIEWIDNISENVRIRMYRSLSSYYTLVPSTLSDGSYNYTIPSNIPNGQYRIYVKSISNSSIYDYGDYFTIQTNAASCTDGIQNGDETGIDCGGSCPTACSVDCQQTDKAALIALYNATDGSNWRYKWDLSLSIENWRGVGLNDDGCVTELKLYSNQLSGVIPPELGNLTQLTTLNLHNNTLAGIIPSELGKLKMLTELLLSANLLTGEIPAEFGSMEQLENLYLYSNQLNGSIPEELSQLSQLKKLYLMKNSFSGCFEPNLQVLCDQIQSSNYYINSGNSFDTTWQDFCSTGTCNDRLASDSNINIENYPNPFKDKTTIAYTLKKESKVSIVIYNALGKQIEVLIDNELQAKGRNTINFNGANYAAGIYYYSIENGENFDFRKMILMN